VAVSFTVSWVPNIRRELHLLWVTASDPAAVRVASDTIEQLLINDPTGSGTHLSEGLWRIVVAPLVVHYTIDTTRRHVEITDCARVPNSHP
jgi:hypothetical protein